MTVSTKIHILGAGSVGCLVGAELSTLPQKPDIRLLFRNKVKADHFNNVNNGNVYIKRLFTTPNERFSAHFQGESQENIKDSFENLIVTTKTYQTQPALAPYLQYIKPTTNILLIQNGMGVVQELYRDVWPDVASRPNIYQGVIGHGCFVSPNVADPNEFEISHAGNGQFFIGKIPRDLSNYSEEEEYTTPLFIQQLAEAKGLRTTILPYSDLLVSQIRKFMVNACINTNTSIINCINGELSGVDRVRELFFSIIEESMRIFYKLFPILKTKEGTEKLLDLNELLESVIQVGIVDNFHNSSSMRQDTLNFRQTEIDYINGFIVSSAEELGEKAYVNQTICNLVKLRLSLNIKRSEKSSQ